MVSHIRDEEENQQGLERLAAHLLTGATLLLGVQAPHEDYARPVTNGMEYAQRITAHSQWFSQALLFAGRRSPVMQQTTDYRTYAFEEAIDLLDKCGFEYRDRSDEGASPFLEFGKR
jgi:hypothetical protein